MVLVLKIFEVKRLKIKKPVMHINKTKCKYAITIFLNPNANWLTAGMVETNCNAIFIKKAAPANSKINLSNEVNFSKTNCQFFLTIANNFWLAKTWTKLAKTMMEKSQIGNCNHKTESPKPIKQDEKNNQKVKRISEEFSFAPIFSKA